MVVSDMEEVLLYRESEVVMFTCAYLSSLTCATHSAFITGIADLCLLCCLGVS